MDVRTYRFLLYSTELLRSPLVPSGAAAQKEEKKRKKQKTNIGIKKAREIMKEKNEGAGAPCIVQEKGGKERGRKNKKVKER